MPTPFLAVPSLLALAAAPAWAQPAAPMPVLQLARHLELSPAQIEQLQKLLGSRRQAMEAKRFAAVRARRALGTALGDPDLPAVQLKALCAAEAQTTFAEAEDRQALLKEAVALLTPDQARKFRKAQAELPLIREALTGGLGGPDGFGGPGGPGGPGHPGRRGGVDGPDQPNGHPGCNPPAAGPEGPEARPGTERP